MMRFLGNFLSGQILSFCYIKIRLLANFNFSDFSSSLFILDILLLLSVSKMRSHVIFTFILFQVVSVL